MQKNNATFRQMSPGVILILNIVYCYNKNKENISIYIHQYTITWYFTPNLHWDHSYIIHVTLCVWITFNFQPFFKTERNKCTINVIYITTRWSCVLLFITNRSFQSAVKWFAQIKMAATVARATKQLIHDQNNDRIYSIIVWSRNNIVVYFLSSSFEWVLSGLLLYYLAIKNQ